VRFCVIGNSHVGSIKRATTSNIQSDHSFTFFAAPGDQLSRLVLDRECLKASDPSGELARSLEQTSGGIGVIDPKKYDAFLVYGLSFSAILLGKGYSKAVVEQAHRDVFDASINAHVARLVRLQSDAPIVLAHNPMLAWRPQGVNIGECYLYKELIPFLATFLEERGYRFLPQPFATIGADGWGTQDKFAAGGTGLGGSVKERSDKSHMNEAYGQLVIAALHEIFRVQ